MQNNSKWKNKNSDDISEYLNDNDNSIDDFEIDQDKTYGPLTVRPLFKHVKVPVLLFFLFYIATILYAKYPMGNTLWASGFTVFEKNQYWRVLTTIFVHGDLMHLFSNAPLFLIFGWFLKSFFGIKAFPLTSLIAGIIATFITLGTYDENVRLIGASGMVYAMAAQWLVYYVYFEIDHSFPTRIIRAVGFTMALLFPTTFQPEISYTAHFAGFITGFVITVLLLPGTKIQDQ